MSTHEQLAFGAVAAHSWPKPTVIRTKSGISFELRCELVQDGDHLLRMREVLSPLAQVVYDSETSGLNPHLGARICGHALGAVTEPKVVTLYYIPVRHVGGDNMALTQLSPEEVVPVLRDILQGEGQCAFHHAKFDVAHLRTDGVDVTREIVDVCIAANIDNENERAYALKMLADLYCVNGAAGEEKALTNWMRTDARKLGLAYRKRKRADGLETVEEPSYLERFGYARTPLHLCGAYACKDVFYTLYLWLVKYAHVRAKWPELWEREHKVGRILGKMEWAGLPVDGAMIRDSHDRARVEVDYWLAECQRLSGDSSFRGTDHQLRVLFYERLKMRVVRRTKSKKKTPSVDKISRKILEKLYPQQAPLIDATSKLARAQKLYGTYTGSFLRFLSPEGRIHPSYNQIKQEKEGGIPVTGRLSSSDPNATNIDGKPLHLHNCECEECIDAAHAQEQVQAGVPALEVYQPSIIEVHRYFTVPEGYIRFYIDFSQIELRVLTWLCQDPVLLHAYANDLDLHQIVADQLDIARPVAKQANFLTVYGGTERALGIKLPGYYDDPDGTEKYASEVLRAYFQKYKRILQFRARFAAEMRANGGMFVSPFGRPRRIPSIGSNQQWERERAERMMMSSIVSGMAADVMKESMIRCDEILEERDDGSEQVQTIHDELVFDTPHVPGWASLLVQLARVMEDWRQFSHPPDREGVAIKVNAAVTTTTWAAKREVYISPEGGLAWAS